MIWVVWAKRMVICLSWHNARFFQRLRGNYHQDKVETYPAFR
jgi:hypothetical protein